MRTAPLAVLLAGLAVPAWAHSFPRTEIPPAGSTVNTAPAAVTINFTEALEPAFSSLQVLNASGRRVDKNDAHLAPGDAKQYSVDVQSLPPGKYRVVWHATSVDTHKTQGSYTFTVK
jgi:copper resistance protein C